MWLAKHVNSQVYFARRIAYILLPNKYNSIFSLKEKNAHLVLHPHKIEYPVKPKVFECTCFVHLLHG